jgi:ribosomal protein L6P/L9E
MYHKLRYSSLLSLKKKNNSVLYLKGPLGINYLKVPYNIQFILDNSNKLIIFYPRKLKNQKKNNISGFLSIFLNSCQALAFGDLMSLNIQGLGFKFLKITKSSSNFKYLSMNLGYSDPVNFCINKNHSVFFLKDIRNIYIYSTDYSYLRNQVFKLASLKLPNKFQKRKNGITLVSIIS